MNPFYPFALQKPSAMELLGIPFHQAGVPEICQFIEEVISKKQKAVILNLNVYCMNLALKHPWLHEFIQKAQLVCCDGDGVRWGLKLMGYPPPPKVTYNKWLWQLAEFCEKKNFSLFFLGAKPGVAQEAAERLKRKYPSLRIAGVHDGYFRKEGTENKKVVDQINQCAPDILLVCFGMPEQEKWIMENWEKLNAHIFLKGGAAFDYVSGRLKMAPEWVIRSQMEWLYRLFQDPRRLFSRYVFGNFYFFFRVLKEKIKK